MKIYSKKQVKEHWEREYKRTGLMHFSIVEVKPLPAPTNMIFYLDYTIKQKGGNYQSNNSCTK